LQGLPGSQLTPDHLAAITEAQPAPTGGNPFVTDARLQGLPGTQLSVDQLAAITAAQPAPTGSNPFVTNRGLPIGLTADQKDALDHAHTAPDANNPVATLADLAQAGLVIRVVAAGLVDLRSKVSSPTLGGLQVVAFEPAKGLATLSFSAYKPDLKDRYLVNALPANAQAREQPQDLEVVNLVGFDDKGFALQMSRPLAGKFTPGPCMVQVSQILAEMPQPSSIEQAIKLYYSLIQQADYDKSWPMLSKTFRQSLGLTDEDKYKLEWNKSGPAILLALEPGEVTSDKATYLLDLNYPRESQSIVHRIRYEFVRDEQQGHPRFDCWFFLRGAFVS
jgi:hypothetical protein